MGSPHSGPIERPLAVAGVVLMLLAPPLTARANDPARSGTEAPVASVGERALLVVSTRDDEGGDGALTLRGAILEANARPGPDVIRFDIPGPGPHTIFVEAPLPAVADAVVVDGLSQPGALDAPVVRIDGSRAAGGGDGLVLSGAASTVRGLAVTNFARHGIVLAGGGEHAVETCFVGVDETGAAAGNGGAGVAVASSYNRIGGVGDLVPQPGNLIASNGGHGVRIASGSGNVVAGNAIGGRVSDDGPLGNARCGVLVSGGSGNVVGGTLKGSGNRIAFNGEAGVRARAGTDTAVMLNAIYDNGGLGIDVGGKGVTSGSAAPGVQELPTLSSARSENGFTIVEGIAGGAPSGSLRLEFYSSEEADPTSHGEGDWLIGVAVVEVDASGRGYFQVVLPEGATGRQLSATATSLKGATSEFSRCVEVR